MKTSIKFLSIAVLFFTFSFAATAQRGGGKSQNPEERAEKETARMVEKLSLNETQAAQIKIINLTSVKKMQNARENNKEDREAMREIRASINAEKTTEIRQVLTEAQFQSYEEMMKERKKGKKGKGNRSSKI